MPAVTKINVKRPKRVVYQDLVALALQAAEHAYAPFSDYHVGCAALLWDGRVYLGVNTENPAIGLTVHGEMSAINAAITDGALLEAMKAGVDASSFIRAIAVIPKRSFEAWPCGHCRDFIAGFGLGMDIVVRRETGEAVWKQMRRLLPFASLPAQQIEDAASGELLVPQPSTTGPTPHIHRLSDIIHLDVDAKGKWRGSLLALAKQAARLSYAPYTKRPAGAAALLWNGSVYTGARVENVGYTLSNDPEQVAINAAIADGALENAIRQGLRPTQFLQAVAYFVPGRPNTWPSGSSRQCLCDFGTATQIIAENAEAELEYRTLGQLLPGAFVPDVLSYWTK